MHPFPQCTGIPHMHVHHGRVGSNIYILWMIFRDCVDVLCMSCVCFVYVLCMFYLCLCMFVYVLCTFCVRFVYVLCMFSVCLVYVMCMFCVCFLDGL